MFLIGKIISFLLSPLIWVIILMVVIVFINKIKWRKRLIWINLAIILIFSNGHIINFFMSGWEAEIIPEKQLTKVYDYGILPGGISNYDPLNERIQFNCAGDRLMQTLELYKKGIIKKIIITGGSGKILNPEEKESIYIQQYLRDIGVPDSVLLIEDQSRSTLENARYVAALYGNDTCTYLLITSAFHVKRALPCFRKQDLNIDPYPVNFISNPEKEKGDFWKGFLPSAGAMTTWTILMKEWVGYVVYKVRGC